DLPRPLHVARGDLQVAPREIDADAIAVDAVEGLIDRNVPSARLERDHEFHLVMHVLGKGADRAHSPHPARRRRRGWRRKTADRGRLAPSRGCVPHNCGRRTRRGAPETACRRRQPRWTPGAAVERRSRERWRSWSLLQLLRLYAVEAMATGGDSCPRSC